MTIAHRSGVMDRGRLAQVAPPPELYEHPVSRWVAGFIGDVNLLDGVVVAADADGLAIEGQGGRRYRAAAGANVKPGQKVSIALRPEKLRLAAGKPDGVGENCVAGRVHDIAYLGDISLYRVTLDDGSVMTVSVANASRLADRAIGWEDDVSITWATDAAVVLTQNREERGERHGGPFSSCWVLIVAPWAWRRGGRGSSGRGAAMRRSPTARARSSPAGSPATRSRSFSNCSRVALAGEREGGFRLRRCDPSRPEILTPGTTLHRLQPDRRSTTALPDCSQAIALGPSANTLNAWAREASTIAASPTITQRGVAYHGWNEIDRAIADFSEAAALSENVVALNNRRAYDDKGDGARAGGPRRRQASRPGAR
jgi:hypothetical protein